MFYTYKNIPISIDGTPIIANNMNLAINNQLNPTNKIEQRYFFDYGLNNTLNTTLNINYFITGDDVIANHITGKFMPINCKFGNLELYSGILSSYDFSIDPNISLQANAQIVFFQIPTGSVPSNIPSNTINIQPLNAACATITISNTLQQIDTVSNLQYRYNSNLNPIFVIDNQTGLNYIGPYRVLEDEKGITVDLVCDNYSGSLLMTGENCAVNIQLNDNNQNCFERFTCSGIITSKTINVTVGDLVKTTLSMRQDFIESPPKIFGFSPLTLSSTGFLLITGNNLQPIIKAFINDHSSDFVVENNDGSLTARVPHDIDYISGKIKIESFGGSDVFSNSFSYIPQPITVLGFDQNFVQPNDRILISGSNFYGISHVLVGGTGGQPTIYTQYVCYSPEVITMIVPSGFVKSYIVVGSSGLNISGASPYSLALIPKIYGFFPFTGLSGTLINISGYAFTGINQIYFNNIPVSGFSLQDNTKLYTYVPNGNTYGLINFSGTGFNIYSPYRFIPEVLVTGNYDIRLPSGATFLISGWFPHLDLLYSTGFIDGNPSVGIKFIDTIVSFSYLNSILLSGKVPASSRDEQTSGLVFILRTSGDEVYSSTIPCKRVPNYPEITSINYQMSRIYCTGYRTDQFLMAYIGGTNLFEVKTVTITGYYGAAWGNDQGAFGSGIMLSSGIPLSVQGWVITQEKLVEMDPIHFTPSEIPFGWSPMSFYKPDGGFVPDANGTNIFVYLRRNIPTGYYYTIVETWNNYKATSYGPDPHQVYIDIAVTSVPNVNDAFQINNGTLIFAQESSTAPDQWATNSDLNFAIQSLWSYGSKGFGENWSAPFTTAVKTAQGVRFYSTVKGFTPIYTVIGNWATVTKGYATDYNPIIMVAPAEYTSQLSRYYQDYSAAAGFDNIFPDDGLIHQPNDPSSPFGPGRNRQEP